jgi:hypothetical protein
MWNLEVIARNVKKLNEETAFKKVISTPAIQLEAIRLNRDEQLFKRGVDVFGVSMRSQYARGSNVYADYTIAIKNEKNQPTNRVTLRDTGAMYRTFKTKIVGDELMLDVNSIKEGKDLQKTWGQFVGLDEYSKEKLIIKSKPIVLDYVKSTILQ